MKRSARTLNRQLNLPLLDVPALSVVCADQERLTLALMELLVHAAQESVENQLQGGTNESPEAHD